MDKEPNPGRHVVDADQIIKNILENKKMLGPFSWLLYYGSKELCVNMSRRRKTFDTHIINLEGKQRIDNETTILYECGKKLMQEFTDTEKQPYEYTLVTTEVKMALWAENKGNVIFNWDSSTSINVRELEEKISKGITQTEQAVKYIKTFYPKP